MRTNWSVTRAQRVVSIARPDRLRGMRALSDCTLAGRWVDVATGRVVLPVTDLRVPGPLGLSFRRLYSSASAHRSSVLGHGWCHEWDQAIWHEPGKLVHRDGEGREVEHDLAFRRGDAVEAPLDRAAIVDLGEGRYEVRAPDGGVLDFAPFGELSRLVRARTTAGVTLDLAYDPRGRPTSLTDGYGRRLSFAYQQVAAGVDRLTEVRAQSPDGEQLVVARFDYDADGDLVAATDPLGASARMEYSGHLLVRRRDRDGRSVYYGYDGTGSGARCVRTWADEGAHDRELAYRPKSGVTTVTDGRGRRRTFVHDVLFELREVRGELRRELSGNLRVRALVQADGARTEIEHDSRGNPTAVREPEGARWRLAYEQERPVQVVDPRGGEHRLRWDSLGQLVERTTPTGERLRFIHEGGRLSQIAYGGEPTHLTPDRYGHPARVVHADGREHRLSYDWLGRLLAITGPDGRGEARTLDAGGRIVERRTATGTWRYGYDREGNRTSATRAGVEIRFERDGAGRLIRRVGPEGDLRLRYDVEGDLIEATRVGPRGEARSFRFERDRLGRVREERDPDGRRWVYRYDGAGRAVRDLFTPDGEKLAFVRDRHGRALEVRSSDGHDERYRRDPMGAVVEAEVGGARLRLERDADGRVHTEHQGDDWVRQTRDVSGCRVELRSSLGARIGVMRHPGGLVSRVLLGEANAADAWACEVERDASGREIGRRLPGGVTVRFALDDAGRLAEREDAGRVSAVYAWEDMETPPRVMRAEGVAAPEAEAVTSSTSTVRDGAGRAVERTDADGRAWRFRYTASGLLREVVRPDGGRVELTHDAYGRRVAMRGVGWERRFVHDGNVLLHELSSDEPPATWVFEPGAFLPLAKQQAGERFGVASQAREPVVAVYDERGEPAWRGLVDAHGRAHVSVERTAWPWRFSGFHEVAEIGLCHARHRYYELDRGEYLTPSPLGLLGGFEPYRYASDPFTQDSPWGLSATPRSSADDWLELDHQLPRTELLARRASDQHLGLFLRLAGAAPEDRQLRAAEVLSDAPRPGEARHDPWPRELADAGLPSPVPVLPWPRL